MFPFHKWGNRDSAKVHREDVLNDPHRPVRKISMALFLAPDPPEPGSDPEIWGTRPPSTYTFWQTCVIQSLPPPHAHSMGTHPGAQAHTHSHKHTRASGLWCAHWGNWGGLKHTCVPPQSRGSFWNECVFVAYCCITNSPPRTNTM